MKKYSVSPVETIELIDKVVLPYIDVLPLGLEDYLIIQEARDKLRPSDALHAATIQANNLDAIASEDKDFDQAGIKRIWIDKENIQSS